MWDLPGPGFEPMSPALAGGFFFFFFLIYLFIYLWLCWVPVSARGPSPVAASGGHSSSRCVGLSLSRPLLSRSTGSRRAGPAIVAHGPSCSAARGILPDQGSNPCPLHWQADPQPLRHQGSPAGGFLTTVPPGKPQISLFLNARWYDSCHIQSNKIVLNEVNDNSVLLGPSYRRNQTKLLGNPI